MKKTECVLYIANTKDADYLNLYNSFGETLEKRRIEKINKATNEKVKKDNILTGVLLAKALSDNKVSTSDIEYGAFDKPYIKDSKKLFYNISHSGDYIVVALSGQEIGVDIQKPAGYNENLVQKICSQKERTDYESLIVNRFNHLWTIKESYSKLCKDGILMDFSKVSFEKNGEIIKIDCEGRPSAYAKEVDMPDGYSLVVSAFNKFNISDIINVCY